MHLSLFSYAAYIYESTGRLVGIVSYVFASFLLKLAETSIFSLFFPYSYDFLCIECPVGSPYNVGKEKEEVTPR